MQDTYFNEDADACSRIHAAPSPLVALSLASSSRDSVIVIIRRLQYVQKIF